MSFKRRIYWQRWHEDWEPFFSYTAVMLAAAVCMAVVARPAHGHEIYTGVTGKDGQLCCGANDCEPTVYEEREQEFYFLTREKHWVKIPGDRITWLPVPGDEDVTTPHHAHLCYRVANHDEVQTWNVFPDDGGESIYFYCAFIPPGAI